jgi:hypothetical protein
VSALALTVPSAAASAATGSGGTGFVTVRSSAALSNLFTAFPGFANRLLPLSHAAVSRAGAKQARPAIAPRRLGPAPRIARASIDHIYKVDTPGDPTLTPGSPSDAKCAAGNHATCSLRQAIADSDSDPGHVDEILVPSGMHVVLGSQGMIVFDNSALVVGTGATVTGGIQGPVFGETVKQLPVPAVQIEGLTISGGVAGPGWSGEGGGINCNSGDLILDHVTVTRNTAETNSPIGGEGGGIFQSPVCHMWLDYTTVSHNKAIGGGLVATAAQALLGTGEGGGVFAGGAASIENSNISSNTATDGAGLFNNGTAVLTSSAVAGNASTPGEIALGVGIYNNEVLDMTGGSVNHNTASAGGAGGGLFNDFTAQLVGTSVSFNSITGSATVVSSCIPQVNVGSSVAACGAGIASSGNVGSNITIGGTTSLTNVTLDGNSLHGATGQLVIGGALFCASGHLNFVGGSIENTVNTASSAFSNGVTHEGEVGGGAIGLLGFAAAQSGFVFGHATISGVTISGTSDTAPSGGVIGGAIFDGAFDSTLEHLSVSATKVTTGIVAGGAGFLELGDTSMSDSTVSGTTIHASGVAAVKEPGIVFGGGLAYIGEEGLGALTLQGVGLDATSVLADNGSTTPLTTPSTTTSTAPSEIGGGALMSYGADLVADGLNINNTVVTAAGGDGIIGGGAIANVANGAILHDTQVLHTTATADDVVGGGVLANAAGGLSTTNITLGNATVTAKGGTAATTLPPGVLGAGFLNFSAATGPISASAVVTNGTFANISASAPKGAQDFATGVEEVGCQGECSPAGIQLTNSTIAFNTVSGPPATSFVVHADFGLTSFLNSIVATTGSVPGCGYLDGAIASAGHNLDSGATCGFSSLGDLVKTNPKLLPLGDYGGPVETVALAPPFYNPVAAGSKAIDAGSNIGCPATDARGVPRPQGGNCDIGAYELPAEGYWLSGLDGGLYHFGAGGFYGSVVSLLNRHLIGRLGGPISAVAATSSHRGYFQAGADGGIFGFGNSRFGGSLARLPLAARIVAIATDATGFGYWSVGAEGHVYAFGDAVYHGSEDYNIVHEPIVAMASTHDGLGYWLVSSDGHVLPFGDAVLYGSPAASGKKLSSPLAGIAVTPDGKGYWLVAENGAVLAFGDAQLHGSAASLHLSKPIVAIVPTSDGYGYWLIGGDGGVFNYGDAKFLGSMVGKHINAAISGAASAGY